MIRLATALLFSLALLLAILGLHSLWVAGQGSSSQIPTPPPSEVAESVNLGFETERSSQWAKVRHSYIMSHPTCEACGSVDNLNVHHVKPFHEHPELELDLGNLITLCREHHFRIGHDPDGSGPAKPNWSAANPQVREDAAAMLYSTRGDYSPAIAP